MKPIGGNSIVISYLASVLKKMVLLIIILFLLPAGLSLGWWSLKERPSSWRTANWQSADVLPDPGKDNSAAVYVMVARTGGMKGALSLHSWIVTKQAGATRYSRYDKLGWGEPVRRNAYAADARWYSNAPEIIFELHGDLANGLIPNIESAIKSYPHSERGGYRIWPGPNSNSFVAHVVNAVPELGIALPSNAVGRDYLSGNRRIQIDPDWRNLIVTWDGLIGFAIGARNGFEIHFMGLVAGVDILNPALKLPGFGRMEFSSVANAFRAR